jgi:hypothetical protein
MMALLRYLYGLPYPVDVVEWHDGQSLLPHALVYTTAEKYQIKKLQTEASLNMATIVTNTEHDAVDSVESSDLLDALRVIIAGTPVGDTGGREVLLAYCVRVMKRLAQNAEFMAAVAETPALGAELIRCQYAHPHYEAPRRKSGKGSHQSEMSVDGWSTATVHSQAGSPVRGQTPARGQTRARGFNHSSWTNDTGW